MNAIRTFARQLPAAILMLFCAALAHTAFAQGSTPQTIAFDPLPAHYKGDAPFAISATASSGLPVAFTSLTAAQCSVAGNTVTLAGVIGSCTLRASQAGDDTFAPADDVDNTFTLTGDTFSLTVSLAGTGAGYVILGNGSQIFCGTSCSASFAEGTQLQLSASPTSGATHLAGWSGCDQVFSPFCAITMTANRAVTATFNLSVATVEPVQSAAGAGDKFTCALSSVGGVRCIGANPFGQLGNNDPSHATQGTPVDVTGLTSGVIDLAVGPNHACALTAVGGVKCWGQNGGRLGDGTTTNRDAPVDVIGLTSGVVKVAAGGDHTCALNAAGGVKCWGSGTLGQLGNNVTQDRLTPVDVLNLPDVVTAIGAGGSHTCVLTQSGGLKCWGVNFDGEIGNNSSGLQLLPSDVSTLTSGVASFSLGTSHTCAVTTAGAAKCWGSNAQGQLGDGTQTSRFVPTDVSGLGAGVARISTRFDHTCVVMAAGPLKCWGNNSGQQLGDATTTRRTSPVNVATITGGVTDLALGSNHSCALTGAGRLFCWGAWFTPAAGGATLAKPAHIHAFGGAVQLDAGFSSACVATTTGARCWGTGIIGDGFTNTRLAPVDVQELGIGTQAIALSDQMACVITDTGGVKCWGNGYSPGGLGTGADGSSPVPVDVSGLSSGATAIAVGQFHACALQGGVVKCWGGNYAGQLGTGDTSAHYVPYAQPGFSDVVQVAAGQYHTCIVRSGGGVRCWGRNNSGQLGDNTFTGSDSPVTPVGLDSGIASIVAGTEHTCALTTAGAVLCWGKNSDLQLGQGGTSTSAIGAPSAVPGLASGVLSLNAHDMHTCALMQDGSAQCWGRNASGQLGDGTHVSRSSPVAVSGLGSDVQGIAAGYGHTCALTWNGTVKCWGANESGQFGNGTTTASNTPQGSGVLGQTLILSVPAAIAPATPAAISATAGSSLAPSLSTWTPNCTLSGNSLTLDSAGRCGVVASQAGDSHTFAAPTQTRVASVSGLATQSITFGSLPNLFTSVPPFTVTATGGASGNPVTFSSLTPTVCTTSGTRGATVTLTPAGGTCTLAADQAGSATFLPASQATASFLVSVATQTLNVSKLGTGSGTVTGTFIDCGATCSVVKPFGTVFTLTAAPGALSRFVSWAGCGSVSGNTCTVTLNANRTVEATFSPANLPQTLTFTPDPLPDQAVTSYQYFFQVHASSNLAVTVASLTPAVCQLQGTTLAVLLTEGPCTIAANQAGNATYAAAPEVQKTFQVLPGNYYFQVGKNGSGSGYVAGGAIDCGPTCSVIVSTGSAFTLTATPDAGSVLTGWSGCDSTTGNVCGAVQVTNGRQVTATFDLLPAQTIAFDPLPDRGIAQSPFTIVASASSGLAVTFATLTDAVCTVSGNSVTLLTLGQCVIRASQPGNASFSPAPDVDRDFMVLTLPPPPIVMAARYRLGEDDAGALLGATANDPTTPAVGTLPLARVGTPHYAAGAAGSGIGVAFNGTTDGFSAPGFVTDATHNFAVEAWVKSNGNTDGNSIIAYVGNTAYAGFGLLRLGASYVGLFGGIDVMAANGEIPVTSAWTHLALVQTNGVAQMYVNGVPAGSTSGANPNPASIAPDAATTVAIDSAGTEGFAGTVDDVRFFTFQNGAFDPSVLNVRTLTVASAGSGTGTVTSDIGGISCGVTCAGNYPIGATVTLTATPDAGFALSGWSGACVGTGPCVVTMSDAASVTATFGAAPSAQSIAFDPLPDRTLAQSPFTISASASSGLTVGFASLTQPVCTLSGNTVTLVAVGMCTIRASQDGNASYLPAPSVDRSFAVTVSSYTVSVSRAGSGIGTVSGPGIDCGVDCTESFAAGASAMLTASASPGSTFLGWSGACSGSDACFLTVDADRSVTATFERNALSGTRGDFDDDGNGDLVLQNTDGRVAIWTMNGTVPTGTGGVLGAGTTWHVAHIADLNGDGKSDLVWQNTDGRVTIYLMDGKTAASKTQILNAGPWTVTQTPDLDGDGKADLLFQNADGSIAGWLMNGASMTAGATLLGPGTGWSVTRVADFDGDGKDDLLFTHSDGRVAIWLMNGLTPTATGQILNAGSGWSVADTADLDGDGKADIVWQHTDGSIAVWLMNGTAMASGAGLLGPGTGWSVTRSGDFDGDGKGDLLFTHTDGRAAIYLMNGLAPATTTQILNAGSGWSAKRIADLNGDGKSDIVWEHTDGRIAVWLMNGTAMQSGREILGPASGWSVSGASQ